MMSTAPNLEEWIGIPYAGCNCLALLGRFYEQVLRRPFPYPVHESSMEHWSRHWRATAEPVYGSLIHMRFGLASHIGVYVDRGRVLHTRARTGSILTPLSVLRPFIHGFYELRS